MRDIVIVGAGVCGCAIARELSKYEADILVIDKAEDVCCATSKANSAIIHAGFDAAEGSLMAKLNVRGNQMMDEVAKELDVTFKRCGSLVVATDEEGMPILKTLFARGNANGVKGLEVVDGKRAREIEPGLSEDVIGALWAPTGGIVCPFTLTFAYAENAAANGVDFQFNTEVTSVEKGEDCWKLITNQGVIDTKVVINAAGVYADVIHNMVSEEKIHITPRRGDYVLLDKTAGNLVSHTVFQAPGKYGKGVLVTPTVHGNILIGPTAVDIENKEGVATTREGLDEVISKSQVAVKDIPFRQVITSFAGLRAHEDGHEFIIGEVDGAAGFVDAAGIESPGLSSAPAIGEMVAGIVKDMLTLREDASFNPIRHAIPQFSELDTKAKQELIKKDPSYAKIVCRCENVTEGEILEAIRRKPGATTVDGIKRRTRAGMGRCQAGFCTPRTMEILAAELNIPMEEVVKSGENSKYIVDKIKE